MAKPFKLKGIKGLQGMGKFNSPSAGSSLPTMKKFLLYKNIFGSTPSSRKKLGPMGPMMGKPQSIGGGIGQPDQGGGIGNIQLIASLHRMGLM